MASPWRIEYEGALYHILSRGNEQRDIFRDIEDRTSFMNSLGEMSAKFDIDIFTYVLLKNHYYILPRSQPCESFQSHAVTGVIYTG
jgi:REP element-mobilizing transposase RayT